MSFERGAIHWADLEPTVGHEQGGRRPVLLASRTVHNDRSQSVVAFPITSRPQRMGFPYTMEMPEGILPKPSWAKVSQVRSLSVDRLSANAIGRAPPHVVDACLRGLMRICKPE